MDLNLQRCIPYMFKTHGARMYVLRDKTNCIWVCKSFTYTM